MDVKQSYISIAPLFSIWVKIFESHTREMEMRESRIRNNRIFILSPPIDPGISLLVQANFKGESYLYCLSKKIANIAREYQRVSPGTHLQVVVGNFSPVPLRNGYFDVVFINCFLDFCSAKNNNDLIREIRRILKGGSPHGYTRTIRWPIMADNISEISSHQPGLESRQHQQFIAVEQFRD